MAIVIDCKCGKLTFELPEEYRKIMPKEVVDALEIALQDVLHGMTNAALLGATGGPVAMLMVVDAYARCTTIIRELGDDIELFEAFAN